MVAGVGSYVEAVHRPGRAEFVYYVHHAFREFFAGGKLVEDWVELDRLGLFQQLGCIPTGS